MGLAFSQLDVGRTWH